MSEENLTSCPICGHHHFSPFLQCKDYTQSNEYFSIQKCEACGFLATTPRPSLENLSKYYKSDSYISHSGTQKGLINRLYHIVRRIALKNKINLINRLSEGEKKLLDYGCGTGAFLKVCSEKSWQVDGVEPDTDARGVASQQNQKEIYEHITQIPDNQKYNIITLWHVLEHIPDLRSSIRNILGYLAPQGKLIIAVPNPESYDAQYFKEFWAAYDVPRHLWHFRKNDIENIFGQYQCRVKEILPMPFDAYYIALLSTKYQKQQTSYIEALKIAWLSNKKGGKQNTSSLIYVIEKK